VAEAAIIYVCITCRGPDGIARDPLPGEVVAAATVQAAHGSTVDVRPVRCLANCSRGPSAAIRANGSWTYIFGGLDAGSAGALITGARMLAAAPDGILPWRGRPDVLKRGLIARIPPFGFEEVP
jgi:predicted metal-binding protein